MSESVVYRIVDWDRHFENAKSRTIDHKSWCAMPNKQDGLGLCRLMAHKNGTALYGAFVATALMASKQPSPRLGWLTDDGSSTGTPYTAADISLRTRVPEKIVADMLTLISTSVGWIMTYDAKDTARVVQSPEVPSRQEGGIGQDRREGRAFADQFLSAWILYPEKQGKAKARTAYVKARHEGVTHEEITAGIERYQRYVTAKRSDGFPDLRWKYGSTWFNQRGWEDEYAIVKADTLPTINKIHIGSPIEDYPEGVTPWGHWGITEKVWCRDQEDRKKRQEAQRLLDT